MTRVHVQSLLAGLLLFVVMCFAFVFRQHSSPAPPAPTSATPQVTSTNVDGILSVLLKRVSEERNDLSRQLVHLQRRLDLLDVLPSANWSRHLRHVFSRRRDLSRQINLLQERHQRLICQTKKQSSTSETGGWCNLAVSTGHLTDKRLVDPLAKLFENKTVVGLGDGRGEYRKLILDTGKVPTYDAFDGAPNINNITGGQVNFLDLTLPQYWLPRYDWVMTLEVLEHIPAKFETIVLDNIDRAAGYGVVLSWAVPGQGGFKHINNKPPNYVKQQMLERGFSFNKKTTSALRKAATLPWLKHNIMVFIRK